MWALAHAWRTLAQQHAAESAQVVELQEQLGALSNFDEAAPDAVDKPIPYHKPTAEPEPAPSKRARSVD